jgi:hypothetical protein
MLAAFQKNEVAMAAAKIISKPAHQSGVLMKRSRMLGLMDSAFTGRVLVAHHSR